MIYLPVFYYIQPFQLLHKLFCLVFCGLAADTKVYVGGGDDYIVISGNDISIFDRFRAAGDELTALAEEMEKKESESGEMDYKKDFHFFNVCHT